MASEQLKKQFDFYLANQENLVEKFNGRVLLIHNESVIGDFSSKEDAYNAGSTQFEPGDFLIIKCSPGERDYTVNYRTVYRFSKLAVA